MSDDLSGSPELPADQPAAHRQVFLLSVEWLTEPHPPATPELLARAVRHAIEHGHAVRSGSAPVHFSVRVKGDDVAVEVDGKIEHHHHH